MLVIVPSGTGLVKMCDMAMEHYILSHAIVEVPVVPSTYISNILVESAVPVGKGSGGDEYALAVRRLACAVAVSVVTLTKLEGVSAM